MRELPWCFWGKESACNAGVTGDAGLFLGREDPLEESMATHAYILAWKVPWTEKPDEIHTVQGITKS